MEIWKSSSKNSAILKESNKPFYLDNFDQLIEETKDKNIQNKNNDNLCKVEQTLKDYVFFLKQKTMNALGEEEKNNIIIEEKPKNTNNLFVKTNTLLEIKTKKSILKKQDTKKGRKSDIIINNFFNNKYQVNENKKLEFHNNIKFKNPSFKSYISQNEKYKKKISNNRIQMKVSFRTNKKNSSHSLFSKKSIKNKNLIEEEYDLKSDIDKRSFFLFKKPELFEGENNNETFVFNEDNIQSCMNVTYLSNKSILQLNEITKELKHSIVGKEYDNQLKINKTFLSDNEIFDDKILNDNEISNEIDKEKYRILTRKGYVYDSFDDEKNIDQVRIFFYFNPQSYFIKFFDFFISIFTFYNLIYIPLFLAKKDIYYFIFNIFNFSYIINYIIDLFYFIDIFISFFLAYYDFDEILITDFFLISKNYLQSWFLIDFISAIPLQTFLMLFNDKNEKALNFNDNNFYYIFILLRLLKIFKVISKNSIFYYIYNKLSEFIHYNTYGRLFISIFTFFISLHIVACIFIFIGKNDYPNWIIYFNHNHDNFSQLYLISIYYTITTITTVGYGDLFCISFKEKIFGLILEIVGIFAYSWALTNMSNYVKVITDKSEELSNKIKILHEIKLNYPLFNQSLYEKILRYLKYTCFFDIQKNQHYVIDELPISLKNTFIYEMFKPIINNFNFFKGVSNTDFSVKVIMAFKPVLALKNDILIKEGDLVDNIIFVKRGRLSLEIPLDLNNAKKGNSLKKNITLLKDKTMNNNISNLYTIYNQSTFKLFDSKKNDKNPFIEVEENILYFRILEIRRNEHFGDILMFLNQRSPLRLKVKSKKAELFFLNKEDAINISTTYPQYWKKINKKSLFNMEQIKRLTNKIIKIFSKERGFSSKNLKKQSSFTTLSFFDEGDNDLRTIPTFTQQSNKNSIIYDFKEDDDSESDFEKNQLLFKERKFLSYAKDIGLNTIIEDDIKESKSSKINSSSFSENDKILTKNKSEKGFKNEGLFNNNSTPYSFEEINNEIYPEESFIIMQRENPFYVYEYKRKSSDNISVCSTEISFSINSEYENINELCDNIYSKDLSFRLKLKNFIQKEIDIRKNKINHLDIKKQQFRRINSAISLKSRKIKFIKKTESNDNQKTNNKLSILKNSVQNLNEEENKKKNENKKDILNIINQNIEKGNMNLNNPDLFFSEIFSKFMNDDMPKTYDKNNKEEEDNIMKKIESRRKTQKEPNQILEFIKKKI